MSVVNQPLVLKSIQVLTGQQTGSSFQLIKPITTLGRDPSQNDIVLTDPSVARNHARIIMNGSEWYIENLTQNKVITVNSRSIQRENIRDHDTIALGTAVTFLFLTDPTSKKLPLPLTDDLMKTQLAPMGFDIPSLEISTNTSTANQTVQLTKPIINIGRDLSNDIVINARVVSAFHAQIILEGSQFVLLHPHPKRAATLNGLLYEGHHIQGNELYRKVLTRGDVFRIGDENGALVTLTFNDGSGALHLS